MKVWLGAVLAIGLVSGYGYWSLQRPLPSLKPEFTSKTLTAQAPAGSLAWPAAQSAVGIANSAILETHGTQIASPTASTAKIITALVVLQKKPLAHGQQGPKITMTDRDVAMYVANRAADGSGVKVFAGEQLSEYQMLQAILLPSANNLANSLAIWAYGSLDAYATAANAYLTQQGLNDTHVGKDASGLDPSSVSTAHDLTQLGKLAIENKVIAEIVSQETASGIPVVGTIRNVNFLLGRDGIVGIKTGNSDQAGGVFVSAARSMVNKKSITLVTAMVKAPDLFTAVQGSLPFVQSAQKNFKPVTLVKSGAVVATYHAPWGPTVKAIAADSLQIDAWATSTMSATVDLKPVKSDTVTAGRILLPSSAINNRTVVDVEISGHISPPSAWWRLTHPFDY